MRRAAPIRVVAFLLLAACGAFCQESPSTERTGSNSTESQGPEMLAWSSLPDAPTPVKPQTQAVSFHAFVNEAPSPLTFPQHLPLRLPQPSSISLFQPAPVQKETGTT